MNDVFNGKRFLSYAVKHYAENWKTYLIGAGGLFILLGLVCRSIILQKYDAMAGIYTDDNALQSVAGFVFVAGLVVTVWMVQVSLKEFRKRTSQLMALGLPASNFEKYLFAWLNSLLLFWVVYAGIFFLSLGALHLIYGFPVGVVQEFIDKDIFVLPFAYMALGLHAAALFCNAYSKHNPIWAYVTFTASIGLGVYLLYLPAILEIMPGVDSNTFFYTTLTPHINSGGNIMRYTVSYLSPQHLYYTVFALSPVFILLFWVAGYFKFRERQLK